MIRHEERVRRYRAWKKTKNDREAADILGISKNTFTAWRRAAGFKPKMPVGRPWK